MKASQQTKTRAMELVALRTQLVYRESGYWISESTAAAIWRNAAALPRSDLEAELEALRAYLAQLPRRGPAGQIAFFGEAA